MSAVLNRQRASGSSGGAFNVLNSAYGDGSTGTFSRAVTTLSGANKWSCFWSEKGTNIGGANPRIISAVVDSNNRTEILRLSTGELKLLSTIIGVDSGQWTSATVLRDYTGHAQYMALFDADNGTASERFKVYRNGVLMPGTFGTTITTGNHFINHNNGSSLTHYIGSYLNTSDYNGDYLSEFGMVSGSLLASTDVGKFDLVTGNWIPKAPVVSAYGTNGFYLNFQNGAALGEDSSGNGNDFTVNGTVTQSEDTPTNNHAKANATHPNVAALSNGNKKGTSSTSANLNMLSTLRIESKVYFEFEFSALGTNASAGLASNAHTDDYIGGGPPSFGWHFSSGEWRVAGVADNSLPSTLAANVRGCIAFDPATGEVWTGQVSGSTITWDNSGDPDAGTGEVYTVPTTAKLMTAISGRSTIIGTLHIEEGEWTGVTNRPTTFKALSTDNLPAVTGKNINDHVASILVNHDGTSTAFTIPWDADVYHTYFEIKNRDTAEKWFIIDTLRGVTKYISSDATTAETTDSNVLSISGTTGTLGSTLLNDNYVVTVKKAGLIGSETSGTTDDGKAYEYSVNTVLGFCITTYTGSGLAGHSIPHGLGQAPGAIIVKHLDAVENWAAYHSSLGATKWLKYNATDAAATSSNQWNDTEPTGSVFTVGISTHTNTLDDAHVAYSYAETDLTKIGSYIGNGNTDGPFINEMISPVWSLQKNTDAGTGWPVQDSVTNPSNPIDLYLMAQSSQAEASATTAVGAPGYDYDAVGAKVRNASSTWNGSTNKHIFLALGQPTGGSNISEATGR